MVSFELGKEIEKHVFSTCHDRVTYELRNRLRSPSQRVSVAQR